MTHPGPPAADGAQPSTELRSSMGVALLGKDTSECLCCMGLQGRCRLAADGEACKWGRHAPDDGITPCSFGGICIVPEHAGRVPPASEHEGLSRQVKELRRAQPSLESLWSSFCHSNCGGTKDPDQISVEMLREGLQYLQGAAGKGAAQQAPPGAPRDSDGIGGPSGGEEGSAADLQQLCGEPVRLGGASPAPASAKRPVPVKAVAVTAVPLGEEPAGGGGKAWTPVVVPIKRLGKGQGGVPKGKGGDKGKGWAAEHGTGWGKGWAEDTAKGNGAMARVSGAMVVARRADADPYMLVGPGKRPFCCLDLQGRCNRAVRGELGGLGCKFGRHVPPEGDDGLTPCSFGPCCVAGHVERAVHLSPRERMCMTVKAACRSKEVKQRWDDWCDAHGGMRDPTLKTLEQLQQAWEAIAPGAPLGGDRAPPGPWDPSQFPAPVSSRIAPASPPGSPRQRPPPPHPPYPPAPADREWPGQYCEPASRAACAPPVLTPPPSDRRRSGAGTGDAPAEGPGAEQLDAELAGRFGGCWPGCWEEFSAELAEAGVTLATLAEFSPGDLDAAADGFFAARAGEHSLGPLQKGKVKVDLRGWATRRRGCGLLPAAKRPRTAADPGT